MSGCNYSVCVCETHTATLSVGTMQRQCLGPFLAAQFVMKVLVDLGAGEHRDWFVCQSLSREHCLTVFWGQKKKASDFPGGPVAKNSPANGGDMGSIPDLETKIPHTTGQLSPCAHLLKALHLDPVLHKRSHSSEKPAHRSWRVAPTHCNQGRPARSHEDPARSKTEKRKIFDLK